MNQGDEEERWTAEIAVGELFSIIEPYTSDPRQTANRQAQKLSESNPKFDWCSKNVENEISRMLQLDHSIVGMLDHTGRSVLHHVMNLHFTGRMEILTRMSSMAGFDVNILDSESKTPLHHALAHENLNFFIQMCKCEKHPGCGSLIDIVRFLINCGADVNALDDSCVHPLHLALNWQSGHLEEMPEVVAILAASSVFVDPSNIRMFDHSLALLVCSVQGPYSLQIMKIIVTRECVRQCNLSRIPLLVSLISECKDDLLLQKVNFLVNLGVDVMLRNIEDLSPLSCAFEVSEPYVEPLVRILLDNGAEIDETFSDDSTFLHKVCAMGRINIFNNMPMFLRAGANIYATDLRGTVALHKVICRITNADEFKFLIAFGVDVTRLDEEGNNAFHHLHNVSSNDVLRELGHLLINQGCSVNHQNRRGETPLLSFLQCQRYKDLEFVQTLIDLGASVNCQNNEGIAPLHIASRILKNDSMEVPVDMFLNAGADVNILDDQKNSALHYALRDGQTVDSSSLSKLLSAGCNPNIPNHIGMTPLHVACVSMAKDSVIELLLDYGAEINSQNFLGSTPIHLASLGTRNAFDGVPETSQILINRGACLRIKNHSGQTPFASCIYEDTFNYLAKHVAMLATVGKYEVDGLEKKLLQEKPRFLGEYQKSIEMAAEMKSRCLGDSSITLLDYLILADVDAARVLRNQSINDDLQRILERPLYSSYDRIIGYKILRSRRFEKMLNAAERAVGHFCFSRPLPILATFEIVRFLTEKDLKSLSEIVSGFADD